MTKHLVTLLLLATVIAGCGGRNDAYALMEEADSLISREQEDSALTMLNSITPDQLKTDKDRAYYNLLQTCVQYRLRLQISSTSEISKSVDYYKAAGNRRNLARALYYKGMVANEFGNVEMALTCLKEAEHTIPKYEKSDVLNYIYANLAKINNNTNNYETALNYAKNSFKTAEKRQDKSLICLSLDIMGMAYGNIEKYDSALYYAEKAIPYIKYLKREEKAGLLSSVSAAYFNVGRLYDAKRYIRQSLAVEQTPHAYYILGSIYLEQGKGDEALALWRKAAETGTPELRAETMLWTADLKKERGEYREAAELMARAEALKDSISRAKDTENMLRLQADMRHADTERKAVERLAATVAVAALAAIVLAALLAYYRKRAGKAKRRLAEIGKLADKYRQRIDELSSSKVENERVINRLKRKMETLRRERAAIIGRGLKLCEDIKGGGTVTTWKREDFEAAVEYCRTMWPEAVNEIESGYKRLTPYNTFFLLLPVIGIADNDIPHAMNMSPGAVRTAKYRLKGKRSVTA